MKQIIIPGIGTDMAPLIQNLTERGVTSIMSDKLTGTDVPGCDAIVLTDLSRLRDITRQLEDNDEVAILLYLTKTDDPSPEGTPQAAFEAEVRQNGELDENEDLTWGRNVIEYHRKLYNSEKHIKKIAHTIEKNRNLFANMKKVIQIADRNDMIEWLPGNPSRLCSAEDTPLGIDDAVAEMRGNQEYFGGFIHEMCARIRHDTVLEQSVNQVLVMENDAPDGVVRDADTFLADAVQTANMEVNGLGYSVLRIWKDSIDRQSVEDLFLALTDMPFHDYVDKCIKETTTET